MEKLIIALFLCLFVSAQSFHVTSGNENEDGYQIIPFGLQDVWSTIQTIEDRNLVTEFQDLLVKLMEANENKIKHAQNHILEPLKIHLESSPERSLAFVAQSVQALTILLFSNDYNRCCNGGTKGLF